MRRIATVASALLLLCAFSLAAGRAAPTEKPKIKASSIKVLQVESDEVKLPPEFQIALYENVIQEITKTKKFQHVYRDGDHNASGAPDLVVIHCSVRGFKQGSARKRQVTSVAGATWIKMHVQFAGSDGRVLLEQDVVGKVRMFGENLGATHSIAKSVAKLVDQNFTGVTAADGRSTIHGAVTTLGPDDVAIYLPGAQILLRCQKAADNQQATVTDENGRFSLRGLTPDKCSVTASAQGFRSETKIVAATENSAVELSFQLKLQAVTERMDRS